MLKPIATISLLTIFVYPTPTLAGGELGPIPTETKAKGSDIEKIDVPFDMVSLKKNWRSRISAIKASGKVPIIDIQSNYKAKKLNPKRYAKWMDKYGVALIAFSPSVGKKDYKKKGKVWTDDARKLLSIDPWRYIPVTTGPGDPMWPKAPKKFLKKTFNKVKSDGYPMMAEFEFRHYMSGSQYKNGETHRDLDIPIDGKMGHKLFAFAEKSGVPFQIHQDIEDKTLAPLEKMLKQYPNAKVIWCHFSQMRFQKRNTRYGPGYIRKLIENNPNLYFDTAFGMAGHVYPGSGEHDARVWDRQSNRISPEWKKIFEDHPWRFMTAFDLGGSRMNKLPERAQRTRRILKEFSMPTREIIAYKAAWKLLFNEDI